jgi:hypothetical protein
MTWERAKQLMLLRGALEDYVLFAAAKGAFFAVGVAVGWHLWGGV